MSRYRYDTGCIIDEKDNEVLTVRQAVNRLNRQDSIIKIKERVNEAMVDELNRQINEAEDDVLKGALVRVANIRLEVV